MEDRQLLEEYAFRGSESAFAQLVERHLGLVHAVALRQVHDPALAADVAQAVFLLLAQKAKSLRHEVVLASWLFRTTRFTAARAQRAEFRRQRREQEAFNMQTLDSESPDWTRLAPELDEALATLKETDRQALLLRFTEGRNHREVGIALGLTEEAAKKRVNRALDRLRVALLGNGVALSAALIAGFFSQQLHAAPPTGLAATLSRQILDGAQKSGPAATLAHDVLRAWRRTRLLLTAAAVIPIVLLGVLFSVSRPSSSGRVLQNVLPFTTSPTSRATAPTPVAVPSQNGVRLHVVAADTGQPIANAGVPVQYVADGKWSGRDDLVTDASGFCDVPLPPGRLMRLDVGAHRSGWENRYFTWQSDWQFPCPTRYELKLKRAETLGGQVVDSGRHPVPGVSIWLSSAGGEGAWSEPEDQRERTGVPCRVLLGLTDAQGRWICGTFSTNAANFIIEFEHPNFEPGRLQVSPGADGPEDRKQFAQLRQQHGLTVLNRGWIASGDVVDAAGGFVSGARIAKSWSDPGITTDADGHFSLRSLPRGEIALVATAEGYAPKTFNATAGGTPVRVELESGGVLRARIVDPAGDGIAGAFIGLAPNDTLEEQMGAGMVGWDQESDADGWVTWRSAPRDQTLAFSVSAPGYRSTMFHRLRTDGSEQSITLQPMVYVTGSVVDASSGAPIPRFKAIPGDDINSRSALFYGTNGFYRLAFDERMQVRVEAEGYGIEVGSPTLGTGGKPHCDFRLKREQGVQGVVRQPDGSAAAGVEVMLATAGHGLQIGRGRFVHDDVGSLFSTTDREGRFTFPIARLPFEVAAIHSAGFGKARVRAGQSVEIQLQPFGEVVGSVLHHGEPARHQPVKLMGALELAHLLHPSGEFANTMSFHAVEFQTTTDAQGRFRFPGVPAGVVAVGLYHPETWPVLHNAKTITIASGEAVSITLGESDARDREVRGRVVPSQTGLLTDWSHPFRIHSLRRTIAVPRIPENLSPDERTLWLLDWQETDAGQTVARLQTTHTVEFAPDGSFVVSGVPPGEYRLNLMAMIEKPADHSAWRARLDRIVVVPELDPNSVGRVHDLGEIQLPILRDTKK